MAYIGKKPEDAFRGLAYYDTFTGDGSTTTFDLSADAPDGGQNDITVVVDNVRQEPGASKSYTLGVDGSGRYRRVTFNTAPDNLSEIYVINPGRSTQLNTVSDNAITAAKIQTDAVTTAKIQDSAVTNDKLAGSIANAKLANSSITINGNAVSLGGSITAGTDWQAVTVADGSTQVNAVAGKGYFLDTNAGVIEVFLPTSPTQGDTVILVDYAGTFATNNVIVNSGTNNIDSTVGSEFILATNNRIAEFVYVDSNKGWLYKGATTRGSTPSQAGVPVYDSDTAYISATGGTVTESGDFKIHTFTGDGCFVVSQAGQGAGPSVVDYLVVAGGGGSAVNGGGGGAGGFRVSNSYSIPAPTMSPLSASCGITVSATTYPITVGAGGAAGGPYPSTSNTSGSNSVFSTITSTGGGRASDQCATANGSPGGSGGGANTVSSGTAGSGNTPPTSPPQGNPGGNPPGGPNAWTSGGGAGGAGTAAAPQVGGIGSYVSPSFAVGCAGTTGPVPSVRYFAGGGAGANQGPTSASTHAGGAGGGGTGASVDNTDNTAGTANTGGGAGAGNGGGGAGAAGGKGIVIIRYKFQ